MRLWPWKGQSKRCARCHGPTDPNYMQLHGIRLCLPCSVEAVWSNERVLWRVPTIDDLLEERLEAGIQEGHPE